MRQHRWASITFLASQHSRSLALAKKGGVTHGELNDAPPLELNETRDLDLIILRHIAGVFVLAHVTE